MVFNPASRADIISADRDRKIRKALKRIAIENGLILRVDPSWFAVAPALVATIAEIDEMCELIDKSLVQALERVDCRETTQA